jgi:WD40 repeat protein
MQIGFRGEREDSTMIPSRFPLFFVAVCLLLVGGTWFVALGQEANDDADNKAPIIEPQVLHVLKRENASATFTFSRNGKFFASNDGAVARVWHTRTWKEVASFTDKVHPGYKFIDLSPDGTILALTGAGREEIKLFDVVAGDLLQTLEGHQSFINALAFSPDGKAIAAIDNDNNLKLWDVKTGKDMARFKTKPKESEAGRRLAFTPDGKALAVAFNNGVVHLLDVKTGDEIRKLVPPDHVSNNLPEGLAFSPDGRFLASGPRGRNVVIIWEMSTGKANITFQWPETAKPGGRVIGGVAIDRDPERHGGISDLAFTGDGRSLIVACLDGWTRVWETSIWRMRFKVDDICPSFAGAPAGPLFAMSGQKEKKYTEIAFYDFRTCVPPRPTDGPRDPEKLWSDLANNDAARAYASIRDLASDPKIALPALDKRLPTVDSVKPEALERHIQDLDDNEFEVRRDAKKRLAELGEVAQPALTKALAKNPSVEASTKIKDLLRLLDDAPQGDRLRFLRAMEVLEDIGSPEARRILKRLAGGDPAALLTREAKAALERLSAE